MLGLDDAGRLLSREVFGEAILYLDTNVFFHALEPQARLYRNFQTLSAACRELGIRLRICQISIDEHRGVISYHRELAEQVEDQIPAETVPKIGSLFYQAYAEAKKRDDNVTIDDIFQRFIATADELSKQHNVELVDDAWFVEKANSNETRKLAQEMQRQYEELRPGSAKRDKAATHDALLVQWVDQERVRENVPVWVVTLDSSLSAFVPDRGRGDKQPLAITLDALLQWIAPLAATEGHQDSMRNIFSEALKHQLLPGDRIVDLQDFLVFAEMEWTCKELPARDVEEVVPRSGEFEVAALRLIPATAW